MAATNHRVRETFIELTDTMVTDFDIIEFLDRLAARCTELLDVSACGILVADHYGVLNLVGASTEQTRLLELAQVQNAEGPCLDAYQTGVPVQCAGLTECQARWPSFTTAFKAAGFTAVQALPMRLHAQRLGAVNLFNTAPGPLDQDTITLGQALTDAATIGIVHQRALARSAVLAEHLQTALNSRIVIEQAKGFLAERLGVTVEDAFAVLRRYARESHLKLTDVASDVIRGHLDLPRPGAPNAKVTPGG